MDCPDELTNTIRSRLKDETRLSDASIEVIAAFLSGSSSEAPQWEHVLKDNVSRDESETDV